jgi:cation diffusion facilitator CzcD-associated flavoprotein CzcO
MFAMIEFEFLVLFRPTEAARQNREKKAKKLIRYLKEIVPKEYQEILTPDYEVGCKRRILDTDWFRSLQHPKIDLTTLPLTKIHPKSVTLGPGRNYPPMSKTDSKVPTDVKEVPADVIIFANGYECGEWLHPLDVTGKGGKSLYEVWNERGGAQAYMGTAMDGFPNFFLIFGPNTVTGHTSVILASENMVNYSLKFIKPILRGDVKTYEVKEKAERVWTERLQQELKNSVWMSGGCTNWYRKGDWNATVYP